MCNLWYYGEDCSSGNLPFLFIIIKIIFSNKKQFFFFYKVIDLTQRKTLVNGGINGGDLAGIVIAWLFGLPAIFCLVKQ